ncbi:Hint domain-containing protein [Psychromarinibacter sp. C21-152]|uniref:Hint domain-containing protein n=1 Tax=Psychromarinibacter sediminicola TaxID=3033385 RepID=A0AAE3NRY4_9RHOB|nr:Hint domain-containing protein [Psychromarinibacter sediminicola]MDF0599850.1 Hint domain-containing protein [Psychromarinibacter sediminicola]
MTLIPDLIELSSIGSDRTYTPGPDGGGEILGVVDDAVYSGDGDNPPGEIVELNETASGGGVLTIGDTAYSIELVVPGTGGVDLAFADGTSLTLTGDGGATEVVFIVATPTNGGAVRYFMAVDDTAAGGDLPPITSITTHALDWDPAGDDVRINLDVDNAISAVCFAAGTRIAVPGGTRPVERLPPGQVVQTMDRGAQPVRWTGRAVLTARDLRAHPHLAPVRFAPGALAAGRPHRALTVSPQHRILLSSPIAARMFGCREVLVPAVKLTGLAGVEQLTGAGGVTYHHLLLDRHEIILAEGAATESMLRGREALRALPPEARDEIARLFPDAPVERPSEAARPIQAGRGRLARLILRHRKNGKPLFPAPP